MDQPTPMALDMDELLVVLIEEAGEIVQAATKCLRFGFTRDWEGYGVNHEVLAAEVGDLLGIVDALGLDSGIIAAHRASKLAKAEKWKAYFVTHPIEDRTSIRVEE